jgi:tRNA pseudouridine32 synthase/23S rRNA pseudouridine746 synthase
MPHLSACAGTDRADDALAVHHEDAHLLVLEKPAGLLCVPGRGADKQDCLSARAQRRWPDARVVHRLDMATSGLVLMARGAAAQRVLGDAFAARRVRKRYEAIVEGVLPERPGACHDSLDTHADQDDDASWHVIDAPIAPDWPRRPRQRIDAAGKPSVTRWRIAGLPPSQAGASASRLALEPLTGRTHQLRVHLASIGHPILGDALYGDDAVRDGSPRLLLHASELWLDHPASGAPLHFASPPPF